MRHILLLSTLLLCSTAFAEEQNRDLPNFTSIRAQSAFGILVEVGKPQSVHVKGSEKFVNNLITEVVGDELVISYKEKNSLIKVSDNAQVIVNIPDLSKFRVEGVGKTVVNNISGPNFALSYEGTGMLVANGKVKSFSLRATGVGAVETKNLVAEQVDARVDGIGSVTVNATDNLNASVHGIGSLTYYGHPRSVNKSVDGIGSVRAAD